MIQITNEIELIRLLNTLTDTSVPVFGKMTAQHMIEHLILTVKISSNKLPHPSYFREEKAVAFKNAIIYSPIEMPVGFKAPMLTEELSPFVSPHIESAINELQHELNYFHEFFRTNPHNTTTNPSMGELNHDEWIVFHNKHFTHHFKQFNLFQLIAL